MVPIIHMNVRYFQIDNSGKPQENIWWFGGGIDLTPHYVDEEDARFFHSHLKAVCDQHHPEYYPQFKQWADDYFFIKHRNETRGVGGIFFDYLRPGNQYDGEQLLTFVTGCSKSFISAYIPIIEKRKSTPFNESHK